MFWILMIPLYVLLHRAHLIHTHVEFDRVRCLTLTHHSCDWFPPALSRPPSPILTLPPHQCWIETV